MKNFKELLVEVRKMFAKKVIPKKRVEPEIEAEPVEQPVVKKVRTRAKPKTTEQPAATPTQEPTPEVQPLAKKVARKVARKVTTALTQEPPTPVSSPSVPTQDETSKFKWTSEPVPSNVQWPSQMTSVPVKSPVAFPQSIAPKETKPAVSFPSSIPPQPEPKSPVAFPKQNVVKKEYSFSDAQSENLLTHAPTAIKDHGDIQQFGGHNVKTHWGIEKINQNIKRITSGSPSSTDKARVGGAVMDFFAKHPGMGVDQNIRNLGSLPLERSAKTKNDLNIISTNINTKVQPNTIRHTITLDASALKGSRYAYQHHHLGQAIDNLRTTTGLEYYPSPNNKEMARKEGKIQLHVDLTHPSI